MNITTTQNVVPQLPGEFTYEPLGVVPATMHRQRERRLANGRRVQCPTCGSVKAPGAVVAHGKPTWSTKYECLAGVRSIYCDGCDHVVKWLEEYLGDTPIGVVLEGPGYSSGTDYIRRYLTAHPQAQEVEQV
jgi:hypothetical protein